jgi:hypothetical protein
MQCDLCGNRIETKFNEDGSIAWTKGYSAWPLGDEDSRCCGECNIDVAAERYRYLDRARFSEPIEDYSEPTNEQLGE